MAFATLLLNRRHIKEQKTHWSSETHFRELWWARVPVQPQSLVFVCLLAVLLTSATHWSPLVVNLTLYNPGYFYCPRIWNLGMDHSNSIYHFIILTHGTYPEFYNGFLWASFQMNKRHKFCVRICHDILKNAFSVYMDAHLVKWVWVLLNCVLVMNHRLPGDSTCFVLFISAQLDLPLKLVFQCF